VRVTKEVNLQHQRQVESICRRTAKNRLAQHIYIDFEVFTQSRSQLADRAERDIDNEVDIVGGTRLAVYRTREATANEVLRTNRLERLGNYERDADHVVGHHASRFPEELPRELRPVDPFGETATNLVLGERSFG
jgi:hypothetical protein